MPQTVHAERSEYVRHLLVIRDVFYASIPKIYVQALGLKRGDLLLWERDGERLIATPVLLSSLKKRPKKEKT